MGDLNGAEELKPDLPDLKTAIEFQKSGNPSEYRSVQGPSPEQQANQRKQEQGRIQHLMDFFRIKSHESVPAQIESGQSAEESQRIHTPYQLALEKHQGQYLSDEVNRAALELDERARQASISEGKIDKRRFRAEFDRFAAAEIGDGNWENADKAYQFYDRSLSLNLPTTKGSRDASMEMKKAHLRSLVNTAPIGRRFTYLVDLVGTSIGL